MVLPLLVVVTAALAWLLGVGADQVRIVDATARGRSGAGARRRPRRRPGGRSTGGAGGHPLRRPRGGRAGHRRGPCRGASTRASWPVSCPTSPWSPRPWPWWRVTREARVRARRGDGAGRRRCPACCSCSAAPWPWWRRWSPTTAGHRRRQTSPRSAAPPRSRAVRTPVRRPRGWPRPTDGAAALVRRSTASSSRWPCRSPGRAGARGWPTSRAHGPRRTGGEAVPRRRPVRVGARRPCAPPRPCRAWPRAR